MPKARVTLTPSQETCQGLFKAGSRSTESHTPLPSLCLRGSRGKQTAVVYYEKWRQRGSLSADGWVQQTERSYYMLSNSPLGSLCPSWCVFQTQFHTPVKQSTCGNLWKGQSKFAPPVPWSQVGKFQGKSQNWSPQ